METWKSIPDYLGYEASDAGRVRSFKKRNGLGKWEISKNAQRILKPSLTSNGYSFVRLSRGGTVKTHRVAALVLLAFVGERPPLLEICHNDGDKTNNRLSNLRYDTHEANMQDRSRHHTMKGCGRFNKPQIEYIRTSIAQKTLTIRELSNEFGVSEYTIRKICKGETYQSFPGPITKKIPYQYAKGKKAGRTSRYRGVCYDIRHRKYRAAIWTGGRGGKPLYLGLFSSEIEAARAYDAKAKEMHGAFAPLNFPQCQQPKRGDRSRPSPKPSRIKLEPDCVY